MSEVREGYKLTELGEIPAEWEVKSLGEIGEFSKGKGIPKKDLSEQGEGCILYGQLYTTYSEVINDVKYATNVKIKNPVIGMKNDLLIPSSGETVIDIATASALNVDGVLIGGDINIFRPNTKVNSNYISYQINSIRKKELAKLAQGSSVFHLYGPSLEQFKVILPNISEQQKIASILSKVDEQIEETEQLIVKTKELKKGLMQHLLTKGIGHTEFKQAELGVIPAVWEIKSFEDIMEPKGEGIRRGPFGGALKKEIFVESGYAVYEQQHVIHNLRDTFRYFITAEKFIELKNFEVLAGDVLISCSGTVGKVLIVPEDSPLGVINQALLRLRPKLKEIDIKFLYYLLTSDFVQKRMLDMTHGSALKNMVSIGELKSILLAIPNTLEEQQKIASILSTVDEQIEVYEQEKAKYEELKKGLMQQLLTGQIRVKI